MSNPITAIGISATVVSAVVGLIVWIVKESFKRQGAITDRYFSHLEAQAAENKDLHDRYASHLDRMAGSLQEITRTQGLQTEILTDIKSKVKEWVTNKS